MDVLQEDFGYNLTELFFSNGSSPATVSPSPALLGSSSTAAVTATTNFSHCCVRTQFGNDLIRAFNFWVEGVLIALVGGFGLLGNILSITVLCNREMRSAFNQLLIVLITVDSILIVMAMFDYR